MDHVVTFSASSIHPMKLICKYVDRIHPSLEFTTYKQNGIFHNEIAASNGDIIHTWNWHFWHRRRFKVGMRIAFWHGGVWCQMPAAQSFYVFLLIFFGGWHLGSGLCGIVGTVAPTCCQILSIIPAQPNQSTHLSKNCIFVFVSVFLYVFVLSLVSVFFYLDFYVAAKLFLSYLRLHLISSFYKLKFPKFRDYFHERSNITDYQRPLVGASHWLAHDQD